MAKNPPTFFEFFAGGGMARLGLGDNWECAFANEWDPKKASVYREAFNGANELAVGDVALLDPSMLPGTADLVWSSFPCQDLSLAGHGAGLKGNRSGTFYAFWDLICGLKVEGRLPKTIVLENVVGLISSNQGHDFRAILELLGAAGYYFGAVVADAVHFLPQSRPRLFIIATLIRPSRLPAFCSSEPLDPWHPVMLRRAHDGFSNGLKKRWIWWYLERPTGRTKTLEEIVVNNPNDVAWHSEEETNYIISLMDETNRQKLDQACQEGGFRVGTIYRRSRPNKSGGTSQRAELRLDGIAGCLRTPAGGSSRQTLMFISEGRVSSRLLSKREAGRLMGVPEEYPLPEKYNDAYHLFGDGVAVPVVSFLNEKILTPLSRQ